MKDKQLLFEISAEVCYKIGGIYSVISSKASYIKKMFGDNYFLIGPYVPNLQNYNGIFQEIDPADLENHPIRTAIMQLKQEGCEVHVGYWMIAGSPFVILMNCNNFRFDLTATIEAYRQKNTLPKPPKDIHFDVYFTFGHLVNMFFSKLSPLANPGYTMIAHFHEYMTTTHLQDVKALGVHTVFTTHATVLGRRIAHNTNLVSDPKSVNVNKYLRKLAPIPRYFAEMERVAAQNCNTFTCVSQPLARECEHLLGRTPDVILYNGYLPIVAANLSVNEKHTIRKHLLRLLHTDPAELDTFFIFSAGRYEYVNKGYDIILAALGKINKLLRQNGNPVKIIFLLITDRPLPHISYHGIFLLRLLQRFLKHLFKKERNFSPYYLHPVPPVFSHTSLMNDLLKHGLYNHTGDSVKVIHMPSFLRKESGPFHMDYKEFTACFDLGIFPSLYEPWGYTPIECAANGVHAIASDTSGIVDYLLTKFGKTPLSISALKRKDCHKKAATENLFLEVQRLLARTEQHAFTADAVSCLTWENLIENYELLYRKAGQTKPLRQNQHRKIVTEHP